MLIILSDATFMAAPPTGTDLEPPVPAPKAITSESPCITVILSGLIPKYSHKICLYAVSCPCPFDWVPICKMIFPFFSKIIVASSGPPPEQASI